MYEARTWVSHFGGQEFNDSERCGMERPSKGRETAQNIQVESVKVFPNPTTGEVFWTGLTPGIKATVYNQLGQKLINQSDSDGYLYLGSLPQGVYYLQLLTEDEKPLFSGIIWLIK